MLDLDESSVSLRIVPARAVVLHEYADACRVDTLKRRISEDGRLINPPVVMQVGERFVVLDGATRTTALKELGFAYLVVQVIQRTGQVALQSWGHLMVDVDPSQILQAVSELPGLDCLPNPDGEELSGIATESHVAVLKSQSDHLHLSTSTEVCRLQTMLAVSDLMHRYGKVERVSAQELQSLTEHFPDSTVLLLFPKFTLEQILTLALAGKSLPAGITRFLIAGRVLRLNVELDLLNGSGSLEQRNQSLQSLLQTKFQGGRVRLYQEHVFLFDE